VVVDPPRTGLEPGLAEALRRLAPRRAVYVSCDPPTLARDLRLLGLPLRWATPVDLMPQTFHVEVVAALGEP
jgi:23S rRNA (uracil1939-C5)-methyltransferase